MCKLLMDVRDLERYMSFRGIDKETLEGSIAQYLTKMYGVPTHYRNGYPAKAKLVGVDELDRFFEYAGLPTLIDTVTSTDSMPVVDVTITNGYLLINSPP